MAILETNPFNPEINRTADRPFFNIPEIRRDPVEAAVQEVKESINPFILQLIDKCEALKSKFCENSEEAKDVSMQLYDAQAAVRRCAEQSVLSLQSRLPKGPHRFGETMYFVIQDPHAKTREDNWLIMLADDANISFMEPRGLPFDDDLKPAGFNHHVRLIEDILAGPQPSA